MFKNIFRTFVGNILFLTLTILIVSCGGGGGGGGGATSNNNVPPANITLESITLTPAQGNIDVGLKQIYKAMGHYSNNTDKDITSQISDWYSSNVSVATVQNGVATGVGVGNATITAVFQNVTGIAQLEVSNQPLVLESVTISPLNKSIPTKGSLQYVATAHYNHGDKVLPAESVVWDSSKKDVATIDNIGLAYGVWNNVGAAYTQITGTFGGKTGSTELTVYKNDNVSSVVIDPDYASVVANGQQQYHATAYFLSGESQNVTSLASWSSSDPSITINNGSATAGNKIGKFKISAIFGGQESNATLEVDPQVSGISVSTATRFPYSVGLNEPITAVFHVHNYDKVSHDLNPTVNITSGKGSIGSVSIDKNSTCSSSLKAESGCDYFVTYTSPSDSANSGTLVNIGLQLNGTSGKASGVTFLAGDLDKFAPPSIPSKVFVIYNDDPVHTIYPVIETSRHLPEKGHAMCDQNNRGNPDYFMMGYLYQTNTDRCIYISNLYRIYVGGKKGIAPGHYEVISLPFYQQYQNPQSESNTYIDWWNGMRIYLYDNPSAVNVRMNHDDTIVPSSSFINKIQAPFQCDALNPNTACVQDSSSQYLDVYHDKADVGFPNGDPMQLVEYTLGNVPLPPTAPIWTEAATDFDMSYVDNLYLTATLERVNAIDSTEGWVGSKYSIGYLQESAAKSNFMSLDAPKEGIWPEYVYNKDIYKVLQQSPAANQIKLPSAHETTTNLYTPFGVESMAVNGLNFMLNRYVNGSWKNQSQSNHVPWDFNNKILAAWNEQINSGNGQIVWKAFVDNYNTNCPNTVGKLTLEAALPYIIGWVPVATCMDGKPAGATALPKPSDSGGEKIIDAYKALMYSPGQTLNPWVDFIHTQLGMKTAYSFSIDDALGNVMTTGDGFVVDIGGASGLENANEKLPESSTIYLLGATVPKNYFITHASVCGLNVAGEITSTSSGIPIIPHGQSIYFPEVEGNNHCQIVLDIFDKMNGGVKYKVSFSFGGLNKDSSPNDTAAIIRTEINNTCQRIGDNLPTNDGFCNGSIKAAHDNNALTNITPPG